jgi:hypothetical protein
VGGISVVPLYGVVAYNKNNEYRFFIETQRNKETKVWVGFLLKGQSAKHIKSLYKLVAK